MSLGVIVYASNGQRKGGITDHGELTGLADDDHTQYLLVNGTRAMSGDLDMDTNDIKDVGTLALGAAAPPASAIAQAVSTAKGSLIIPVMTEAERDAIASPATELQVVTSDWHMTDHYDGVRWRGNSHMGYAPYAFPRGVDFGSAHNATSVTIAANGGSWAFPIDLVAHMLLRAVTIYQTATASARTWAWDVYVDSLNNNNTLTRIAASNGSDTFTPGAASFRTLAATSAPVYLRPGSYWLVIQNRHATNTFIPGVVNAALDWGTNYQEKTTTNPNGSTLDFVAATWTKPIARTVMVRLEGDVFGTGATYN